MSLDPNQTIEVINTVVTSGSAIAAAFIPNFIDKTSKAYKRAEKIKELLLPEIQKIINDSINNFDSLNENDLVKYLNMQKIIQEAFLDLEADNLMKQKLLNNELNKLLNENGYKYIYNKVSTKDLELLNILGKAWLKLKNDSDKKNNSMMFLPTFALLDIKNIKINNLINEDKFINSFYNKLVYIENKQNLINIYNSYQSSILNLLSLNLIVGNLNDSFLGTIEIKEFSDFVPYDLTLTNKGKEIYEMIKE